MIQRWSFQSLVMNFYMNEPQRTQTTKETFFCWWRNIWTSLYRSITLCVASCEHENVYVLAYGIWEEKRKQMIRDKVLYVLLLLLRFYLLAGMNLREEIHK